MLVSEIFRFSEIVAINLMLSGDNAILVGMAVLKLPEHQQKLAAVAGVSAGSLLQMVATLALASILHFPAISLIGGVLLEAIAIRFLSEDRSEQEPRADSPRATRNAIATVAIAYVIVSLDNVMAVAAVGRGHPLLLVVGLGVSCAIVVVGSIFIAGLMRKFHLLIFVGAAVLGWTAGELVTSDPIFRSTVAAVCAISTQEAVALFVPLVLAVVVVLSPYWNKPANVGR